MKKRINPNDMKWLRKPSLYVISNDKVVIETEPYTSFGTCKNSLQEAFGMMLETDKNFIWTVRMDYQFHNEDDGCGIFVKKDDHYWCRFGLEHKTNSHDLSCCVYQQGYSDRSVREIGEGISWLYLRLIYWQGNARFQYSFNNDRYSDMRWLHFEKGNHPIEFGLYAYSLHNSYFDVTFSQMDIEYI